MVSVDFKIESRYQVDRERIKKVIVNALAGHQVMDNYEVSVVVCGERRIRELHRKYLSNTGEAGGETKEEQLHEVLAFPLENVVTPEGVLVLGDIVLCYPQVLVSASENNRLVDDEIDFLVEHAVGHLMGIHHD